MRRVGAGQRGGIQKQFPLTGAQEFRVTAYRMGASGNDADRCERHPEYVQ
jgi:hypothetical protein